MNGKIFFKLGLLLYIYMWHGSVYFLEKKLIFSMTRHWGRPTVFYEHTHTHMLNYMFIYLSVSTFYTLNGNFILGEHMAMPRTILRWHKWQVLLVSSRYSSGIVISLLQGIEKASETKMLQSVEIRKLLTLTHLPVLEYFFSVPSYSFSYSFMALYFY